MCVMFYGATLATRASGGSLLCLLTEDLDSRGGSASVSSRLRHIEARQLEIAHLCRALQLRYVCFVLDCNACKNFNCNLNFAAHDGCLWFVIHRLQDLMC